MQGIGRTAARCGAFGAAYAAGLAVSIALHLGPSPVLAVNLGAGGVAAVALARAGRPLRGLIPYLAVAAVLSVAVRTAGGLAAPAAVLLAGGNVVEVLVLGVLVGAYAAEPGLSHARRAVLLLLCGGLAAAAGSLAAVPALVGAAGPDDLGASFAVVFWCRVGSHVLGILTAGAVVDGAHRLRRAPASTWLELGGWALALVVAAWAGLGTQTPGDSVRPYLPLAVLLVAVLRLGGRATAVLVPGLVLGTVAATAAGGTVFAAAGRDAVQTVVDVQLYCVVVTIAAWCAAAVTDDRAAAVEELRSESATLSGRLDQQRLALTHVEELTAPLGHARGLEQVLDRLMPRLARIVGADTVRVLLLDADDGTLVGGGALGLDEEVRDGTRVPVGEGFAGTVAATGRPWVVDDLRAVDVRSPVLRTSGLRSLAGVPLLADGEVVGVLHVGSRRVGAFSAPADDPVPWLERVAEPIAAAVARDRLAADLARADARGRAALDELLDPVTVCRPVTGTDGDVTDFTVVYTNHAARAWGSRVGVALAEPLTRSGLGELLDAYRQAYAGDRAVVLDGFRLPPAAGTSTERFLDLRMTRRGNELLVTWRDVSARRLAEQALEVSEQRFRMAFDDAPVGMALASLEPGRVGQYLQVNEAFARITGRSRDWHVGRTFRDLDHPDEQAEDAAQAAELATGERAVYDREKRVLRPDGETVWMRMTASAVRSNGVPVYVVGHAEDVTVRRRAQDELARRALHDGLTGLANRHLFMDHLRLALRGLDRRPGTLALLLLDLDKFKDVNDSLGHAAGDEVIREIGHRLDAAVRGPDTAARLAGDEFVVVAKVRDDVDAVRLAERLAAAVARPLTVRGRRLAVLPSVGVTTTQDPHADPDALLREADLAMYQSKRSGRRPWELYDENLHRHALERLAVTDDLRDGLAHNRFRLLYQPVVDLRTGRVIGAEALLRLEHPERGLLSPAAFIDVAEDSDLIVPLGGWVLEEACRRLAEWHTRPETAHLHVAVNVSGRQAGHGVVREQVRRATSAAGVDPRHVVLEITERVLVEAPGVVEDLLSVTDLGCRIAIDDFGTGWSSLAYLKRFPVSTVKIDRSFVEGLGHRGDDTAIVEAVTALARTLDLTSVAEGVETPGQLAELRRMGCHQAQGYHFGRPMPADELAALASGGRR